MNKKERKKERDELQVVEKTRNFDIPETKRREEARYRPPFPMFYFERRAARSMQFLYKTRKM